MIKLVNVNKLIVNKEILRNINLTLPDTGLVVIKGKNGSGKSSLLNIISGIDNPSTGNIYYNNIDITKLKEEDKRKFREKYISLVFQKPNLFLNSNVNDNITIVDNKKNIKKVLHFFNLENLYKTKVKKLSGGEKEKVALARGLIKKCLVLCLDEPTSNLDVKTKINLYKYLKNISKHKLVIMVSHDSLNEEYADIIINMHDGEIENIINKNTVQGKLEFISHKNNFNSIKFVINNHFTNKIKLIFNSILLIFIFTIIILFLSLKNINIVDLHASSLALEKDSIMVFNNQNYNNVFLNNYFNEDDITYLNNNKISKNNLIIGKNIFYNNSLLNFTYLNRLDYLYDPIERLTFIDINNLTNEIIGKLPEKSNEIVISSTLADVMSKYGVKTSLNTDYYPSSYEEFINSDFFLLLGNQKVKVVGIYLLDEEKYNDLKDNDISSFKENILRRLYNDFLYCYAGNIYVNSAFFNLFNTPKDSINPYNSFRILPKGSYITGTLLPFDEGMNVEVSDGRIITELQENEIIVNQDMLNSLLLDDVNSIGKEINIEIEDYITKQKYNYHLTIVGMSNDENYYINSNTLKDLLTNTFSINKLFIREDNEDIIRNMLIKFDKESNPNYYISSNYSNVIEDLTVLTTIISFIFKYLLPIFIILSIILLINYIYSSIKIHQKDIAILKSFGISNNKINLLFIEELGIISFIALIISLIIFLIIKFIINYIAYTILSFKINVLPLNIFSLIIIFSIILGIIIITILISQRKTKKLSPEIIFKIN